ncbi:MAG: hypothetical protein FVQ80_01005 [Planctomycetes bacterium]|nr:hypothetical protein [Planctomycetota bacterium]
MKKLFVLGCVMLLTIGLFITGCTKKSEEGHTDHEHEQAHGEKSADVLPAGANLMCPVMTDQKALGSLFVEYNDKKIYVCCNKCLNRVKDDPALWYPKAYGDKDKH